MITKILANLIFSWENIPQVQDDVKRLKMYLSDLINKDWIRSENVIFSQGGSPQ